MSDYPTWSVVPTIRCSQLLKGRTRVFCGKPARWLRRGGPLFADAYFCDAHRSPVDVELVGLAQFRRVTVSAVIYLAGVAPGRSESEHEALDQLEAAVAAVGGILHVLGVTSTIGQGASQAAAPRAPAAGGVVR